MHLYMQFIAYTVVFQICDLVFVYCYFCITYFQSTKAPPDVMEVVETDQKAFEDLLQARTEKDVEVFDQVKMIVLC